MVGVQIRRDDPANPALSALLATHVAEQRAETPPGFSFALDVDSLRTPDIAFWSAWDAATPVGMVALRRIDATRGEVKSMRALPAQPVSRPRPVRSRRCLLSS